ncbi:MAG: signal peptidase I [Gemmatimonadota bacterium]|nr:signal peptidase I [Gemmatimonadota bacterium]MDH3421439.1 signal peptidase I [Gemmatimonadota bacterium]
MASKKTQDDDRADASGSARKKRSAPKAQRDGVAEWFKSIAIALVLFLFLRTFLIQTFVITSGSMEETLLVGDMLVVNRAALGSRIPGTNIRIPGYSSPRWGDVLVFDPPHEETIMLIKRLVGMPGDTVEMRSRVLYRNGERVEEPYVVHADVVDEPHPWMVWQRDYLTSEVDASTYSPTRDNWGPLVIPEGHYFTLGDNRERSLDSRYWGLLERWRLEGRAVFTYFSYNKDSFRPFPWIREIRWGRLGDAIR